MEYFGVRNSEMSWEYTENCVKSLCNHLHVNGYINFYHNFLYRKFRCCYFNNGFLPIAINFLMMFDSNVLISFIKDAIMFVLSVLNLNRTHPLALRIADPQASISKHLRNSLQWTFYIHVLN